MTAAETTTSTALVTLPAKETAIDVFSKPQGLEPFLQQIRAELDAFIPDVSTRKGRDEIASIAHKVARSKTALDNLGKELVADLKELPKKIDAERKRMRETLDQWKDDVRAPLTEWEAAEQARKDRHEAGIAAMCEALTSAKAPGASAAQIAALLQRVDTVAIGPEWDEYEAEAFRTRDAVLAELRPLHQAAITREAEQAELARLRAEKEERDRRDHEERIAREAREQAQREAQEAADKAQREAEAATEKAERERREAVERAEKAERDAQQAAEQERQRIADEQRQRDEEQRRREADVAHKAAVMTAAKEAIMQAGITEDQAREVVKLICRGQVPRVSISF